MFAIVIATTVFQLGPNGARLAVVGSDTSALGGFATQQLAQAAAAAVAVDAGAIQRAVRVVRLA